MKINIYLAHPTTNNKETTSYFPSCFANGLKKHGYTDINYIVANSNQVFPADLSVIWGIRHKDLYAWHYKNGGHVVTIERGYTPPRMNWTMAGFDGLNGFAEFCNDNMPSDRWEKYHNNLLMDWNPEGKYVLVLGQTLGDTALYGTNVDLWAKNTVQFYKKLRVPVVFRPHPGAKTLKLTQVPDLNKAIDESFCVVTYNSSAGVTSILRGKPTIAIHPGTMIWDVSAHSLYDYDKQYMPDRTQWANNFAYTQWLAEEMSSGDTWEHLKRIYIN